MTVSCRGLTGLTEEHPREDRGRSPSRDAPEVQPSAAIGLECTRVAIEDRQRRCHDVKKRKVKVVMQAFLAIIGGILAIYAFLGLLRRCWRLVCENAHRLGARRATLFNSTIRSARFHQWKAALLDLLYDDSENVRVLGIDYPVICYKASVSAVMPAEHLEEPDQDALWHDHERKPHPLQSEFLSVLGATVMRPESIAYALRELLFDENGCLIGYWARICTFKLGLVTSFILEYELFKAFLRCDRKGTSPATKSDALRMLAIRTAIHGAGDERAILCTGANRHAMLSVQMMILFRSHVDGTYRTFVIKRSDSVSYGPNTWQFVPCGYFEMFESHVSKYSLKSNFDSRLAVFREMLEELFGKTEFIENPNGIPADDIMNDLNIRFVTDAIEDGSAHFRWLGTVLDLVTLTHKLSYLLVIDDPVFSKRHFEPNFEATHLQIVRIEQMSDVVESDLFLPESAGLLQLALEHPLVRQRIPGIAVP